MITTPLTDLFQHDNLFLSDQAEKAFLELKQLLSTALVLKLLSFDKTFVFETDASNVGIDASYNLHQHIKGNYLILLKQYTNEWNIY